MLVEVGYRNFREAFALISYCLLLLKFRVFGIGDRLLKWIREALCSRAFCVLVGESN